MRPRGPIDKHVEHVGRRANSITKRTSLPLTLPLSLALSLSLPALVLLMQIQLQVQVRLCYVTYRLLSLPLFAIVIEMRPWLKNCAK